MLIPLEVVYYMSNRDRNELPAPLFQMDAAEAMMMLAIEDEVRSHGLGLG